MPIGSAQSAGDGVLLVLAGSTHGNKMARFDSREGEEAPVVVVDRSESPTWWRCGRLPPTLRPPFGSGNEEYCTCCREHDLPGVDPEDGQPTQTDGQGGSDDEADKRIPH
jgi:hypothetical protein